MKRHGRTRMLNGCTKVPKLSDQLANPSAEGMVQVKRAHLQDLYQQEGMSDAEKFWPIWASSSSFNNRSLEFRGGWFRTCIGQSQLYPIRLPEGVYVVVCMTRGVRWRRTSPVLPDGVKCHSTRLGHSYLTFGCIVRTQVQKAGGTSKVGVS